MDGVPEKLGAYDVERELGRGGMGVVYLARDPRLDRLVAIKALNEELGAHPERLVRFEREARTLAAINNPNIAAVYGLDEELGRQLLVLEYVPGVHLGEYLKRTGRLEAAEAAAVCVQIAAGLEGAHETGIVHRDLKPANVRVREDGVVKVLDFGLAKPEQEVRALLGDNDETLSMAPTAAGRIMGTAGYMSPEQARGKPVDKRADIWSFGVVLYECLAGQRAFGGETPMDAMVAILEREPDWEKLPSEVPAGLRELLSRCLEKDPKKRLRDIGDARIELETLLGSRSRPDPRRFLAGPALAGGEAGSGSRSAPIGFGSGHTGTGTFGSGIGTKLGADLSSFIGREQELVEIAGLLAESRLVTLAGAGGCGKSRLAIEVARRATGGFRDGVWRVDLASVEDPEVVATEIAGAFGLTELGGRPAMEVLSEALADREVLLVVDNCEHLGRDVSAMLARMLADAEGLRILATTREALGVAGEWVFRVGVLGVPAAGADEVEEIEACESVRLFAERARAVKPGFAVDVGNAVAVATICRELDGVPLAIELAAARMKMLSCEQIASRLGDRFKLLRSRTGDPRQQTLLAAIEWSYEQLDEVERAALQRVSVFRDGATLYAAEAVVACEGESGPAIEDWEVLDLLEQLIDKSLLTVEDGGGRGVAGETRYRVLESIRQYGAQKLAEDGGLASARDAHLAWCARFAARAESQLLGRDQNAWFERVEAEQGNIRAALDWVFDEPTPERIEAGRVIGAGLWRAWAACGGIAEGRRWLLGLDKLSAGMEPTAAWARVREGISSIATVTGDLIHAVAYGRAGLQLARHVDQDPGRGDPRTVGGLLACLGAACLGDGLAARARDYFEESLEIRRSMGDRVRAGESLCGLALCAVQLGEYQRAEALLRDAEQTLRGVGGGLQEAAVQAAFAESAIAAGRASDGAARLEKAGAALGAIGAMTGVPWVLELWACVAVERDDHERALRLLAAAGRGRDRLACPARPSESAFCEKFRARAQDGVDADRRGIVEDEGRAMSLRRALRYAKGEG